MTKTLVKKQSQPKPVRCFKAISESSKLQAIPQQAAPHIQPIRVLFNRAIQLWVCNSVNVTCTAIVFQAVLYISVTQNPLIRAHRPKAPKTCNPPLNADPESFSPPQTPTIVNDRSLKTTAIRFSLLQVCHFGFPFLLAVSFIPSSNFFKRWL